MLRMRFGDRPTDVARDVERPPGAFSYKFIARLEAFSDTLHVAFD
jgi:hypothetical protein